MDWMKSLLLVLLVGVAQWGWTREPAADAPPAANAPAADAENPANEARPEDEQNPASDKTNDADAASSNEQAEEPAQESVDESDERRQVEWSDQTAAVFAKRYPENLDDLKIIQQQTQRVIEHSVPAVVAVQVGGAFGSAVIVSPDGLVLTAGHVVGRPGQPVRFIFADGRTARGITLGMYREIDSGMMRITDPGPWPYVDLAKSGDIKTGEWVVAIGQPGGFDRERTPPVRLGRVLFASDEVISTDCTLVGGDSGGPLFNMRGEVVGIHSRIGRRITDNFHVPISTYRATWERLVAGELWGAPLGNEQPAKYRPLLGVAANPRSDRCELTEVHPPYPAYKAGIRVGDIVTKYNDEQVDDFDTLRRLVYSTKPGSRVKIEVQRGDETLKMELTLGLTPRPLPGSAEMPPKDESDKGEQSDNDQGPDQGASPDEDDE